MRIKLLLCWILCLSTVGLYGQYGNSWIDYTQPYVKLTTEQDDLYRVDFASLVQSGFPLNNTSSDFLKLYHRGEEVAILVEDGGDGVFDSGDYFLFYGRRNDGVPDVELFNEPRDQIHQYYNLFSDQTAFFLTISEGTQGIRMAVSNESSGGLSPVSSHDEESLNLYTNQFSFGQYYPIGNPAGEAKLAQYDAGQMFIGSNVEATPATIAEGTNFRDFVISNLGLEVQADGKPELELQLVGLNNRLHNARVYVGPNTESLRVVRDDIRFNYMNSAMVITQVEWTDIAQGRLIVRIEEVGFDDIPRDVITLSYIKVTYPQRTDIQSADKKFLYLPASASDQLVTIQNVLGELQVYDVTNYKSPVKLTAQASGNAVNFVIPANSEPRKILAKRVDDGRLTGPDPERIEFQFEDVLSKDYVMISHEFLRTCEGCDYPDPVQAYIDYRESAEGGSFNVLYADVNDLYNEFNYGEYSPLAIRRFASYVYDQSNPRFLFLIGKSRRVDNRIQRLPDPMAVASKDLVPTMGAPGSDILFTEGLDGRPHVPAYPVGRLSVNLPEQVGFYLDKVVEKESTLKDSPWTKNFIQLSGGLTTNELIGFRDLIHRLGDQVSGEYLGASVTNFSKQTNNAVQKFNISEEVNRGVGFVTFFGHSSASFTDIDIGQVSDPSNGYDNQGRYPAFLVNGCRGGEIFFFSSFGEDWLAAENKGAVSYMAHSDVGLTSVLDRYSRSVYNLLADTLWMARSVGEIQQQAIVDFLDTPFLDEATVATAAETVLQGDPAIPIFGHDKVDYIVRPEDIFVRGINGAEVTATSQFFELGVVVNNGGRTTDKPLSVRVVRRLDDGTELNLPIVQVPPVDYRDTVYYEISNQGVDAFGENTFEVILDAENLVDEGSELNNSAMASFTFPATGTFNTSPHDFALVDQTTQTLVAQSANLKLNNQTFVIEIDTSRNFDSQWKQSTVVSGQGLASWDVTLLPESEGDTMRYYWRSVFQDELSEDPVPWNVNTFTYIRNGPEGWGQTIFGQFDDLDQKAVSRNFTDNRWIFTGTITSVLVTAYGADHAPNGNRPAATSVIIDQDEQIAGNPCDLNTLNAIAFNKDSGRPYFVLSTTGVQDPNDPLRCGQTPSFINTFRNDTLSDVNVQPDAELFTQYINGVDDGDSVLLFSVGELVYADWRQNVIDGLGEIGVSPFTIFNMQSGEPVIIYGAKGSSQGSATVVQGVPIGNEQNARNTQVQFETQLIASTDSGSLETPVIGPAASWGTMTNRILSDPGEDELTFEVRGIAEDGTEVVLFPNVTMEELDISTIDAATYPYLRLYLNMVDRVSATPAQPQRWTVTYQGVPEGVVTLLNEENQNITLQEGEPFEAQFRFTNISAYDFNGPLSVRYTITNQISGQENIGTTEIAALAAGAETTFNIPITTAGRVGLNDLEVFVNPGDQLEQYYNNNVIRLQSFLDVQRDKVNPNVDVTFDGIYILDGDVVSPTPLINIELRDNNPYLLKTDGTGVEIKLGQVCDDCELELIDVNAPEITIIPATTESNFRIEFSPDFMQESMGDGIYRLEVEVPDASGNQSGIAPYAVNFEVVTASTVTHFYPYPNPFSTSTRFVFTLTGNEIPDQIKIQIFTVSGKLVREITQEELGPIRIGQNISQYAWDGRDEFGDQLANGTYVYRVLLQSSNGTEFGRRGTGKDRAFDNGFGKLVILR